MAKVDPFCPFSLLHRVECDERDGGDEKLIFKIEMRNPFCVDVWSFERLWKGTKKVSDDQKINNKPLYSSIVLPFSQRARSRYPIKEISPIKENRVALDLESINDGG